MIDAEESGESVLDLGVLRALFQQLQSTDIDELEVLWGSSRLYLRREPGRRLVASNPSPGTEGRTTLGSPIVAPLAGIYYSRPSPEQPPFVSPGDIVVAGQVVALIETMKLFNEVIADRTAEVVSVEVADRDLVEVGQPLIYVVPQEEGIPE